MKKTHRTIVAAIGLAVLSGCLAYGDAEPATNNNAPALYDFPVERVHALVQLYREGGDYQSIAVPMLTKMGQAAHMELLAMRRAATDTGESRAIGEILTCYFEPAQPSPKAASEKEHSKKQADARESTKSATKEKIAEQAPQKPPQRKPSTSGIASGAMGITNPLQPSATRF